MTAIEEPGTAEQPATPPPAAPASARAQFEAPPAHAPPLSPARIRRDPDAIRHAFETGEYPYQTRMSVKVYEAAMADLQVELLPIEDPVAKGLTLLEFWDELENLFERKVDLLTDQPIKNPFFRKALEETKILVYDRESQEVPGPKGPPHSTLHSPLSTKTS